ncbi:MAG: class I SAM-dependent methyltransferase [Betaproteobacteria bacterium]
MPIISARSGKDEREALLAPALLPLFDNVFIDSFDLCAEFVARKALRVLQSTGLEDACATEATVAQAVARAGLAADVARVPAAWLLETLAARAWVDKRQDPNAETRYRVLRPLPALDPDETLAAQEKLDASYLPSYQIVTLAAEHYPAVLRGQITGEQALFDAQGVVAWVKYFSNANPLYGISNAIGALAAEPALGPDPASILEIGGGLGSGAEALLDRLEAAHSTTALSYRFTELSALFMKRAQRTLAGKHPGVAFTFASLDIDRPFAEQGIPAGTHTLAYGVNVLHVAHDLAFTLGQIKQALAPQGRLVVSECVRPIAGKPLHVEFVFNLLASFRNPVLVPGWRSNGGFLTPEQWTAALEANGFADVRIFPDIAGIRDAYPEFAVAAISARSA